MKVLSPARGACLLLLLVYIVSGGPSYAQQSATPSPPVPAAPPGVSAPAPACLIVCAPSDPWRNSFSLYLWVPAVYGDIAVRGREAHLSNSIADTYDALSSLTNVFTGHYEGGNSRWTLIADLLYMKLSDRAYIQQTPITVRPKQTIAELAAAYTVQRYGNTCGRHSDLQAIIGARYTDIGLSLESVDGVINVSRDKDWVDPFIGARYRGTLSPRWCYSLRGDIGGFGIGDASKFTWSAVADITRNLSKTWAVDGGWKWLKYNYDQGSGTDEFKYDVMYDGPYLALTIKF